MLGGSAYATLLVLVPATKKTTAPLVDVVSRFDAELKRYAELVGDTSRLRLTSEKQVGRAQRALEQCAEGEQRLAVLLTELVSAMRAAQAQQEGLMAERIRTVQALEDKMSVREVLMGRLAQLGQHARDVSIALSTLVEKKGAANSHEEVVAALTEVNSRTEPVVREAEALRDAAREVEWLDIARDADSFGQQIGAARKHLHSLVSTSAHARKKGAGGDGTT